MEEWKNEGRRHMYKIASFNIFPKAEAVGIVLWKLNQFFETYESRSIRHFLNQDLTQSLENSLPEIQILTLVGQSDLPSRGNFAYFVNELFFLANHGLSYRQVKLHPKLLIFLIESMFQEIHGKRLIQEFLNQNLLQERQNVCDLSSSDQTPPAHCNCTRIFMFLTLFSYLRRYMYQKYMFMVWTCKSLYEYFPFWKCTVRIE